MLGPRIESHLGDSIVIHSVHGGVSVCLIAGQTDRRSNPPRCVMPWSFPHVCRVRLRGAEAAEARRPLQR
jgi:hypothetical protein